MFTGIVTPGRLVAREPRDQEGARLRVDASELLGAEGAAVALGDSVAVNGCCLTVVEREEGDVLVFDTVAETMRLTSLGELELGARVNLELALRVGDRLGGHMVSGHVDGTGVIRRLEAVAGETVLEVETEPRFCRQSITKGSIAIDGISLTLTAVTETTMAVALIPHTLAVTNLGEARLGQRVNIETDQLGKQVERLVTLHLERAAERDR